VGPVWAPFTIWEIFLREKSQIAKELSQKILISKKKTRVCLKRIEIVENIFLGTGENSPEIRNHLHPWGGSLL